MRITFLFALMVTTMALFSCAGTRPSNLGVQNGRLAPCPSSPNCVSSDAATDDVTHYVAPLTFSGSPEQAWQAAQGAVQKLPRTEIITESPGYLHAESTSALMGFVDDLELELRPNDGVIAVRSASRLGYGDMGVNRTRVEKVRGILAEQGVVEAGDS